MNEVDLSLTCRWTGSHPFVVSLSNHERGRSSLTADLTGNYPFEVSLSNHERGGLSLTAD